MKNSFFLLSILTTLLGLESCSTEVNTNAPFQEIPVVYGVLNPDSSNHFLRITKAFQNADGSDARDIAKNDPARFNYASDELDVKLFGELSNGSRTLLGSFIQEENSWKSADGEFGFPTQLLYRNASPINLRERNYIAYVLEGLNVKTGKTFSSRTLAVGNYTITSPSEIDTASSNNALQLSIETGVSNFITIQSQPTNGTIYRANIILRYREFFTDGSFKDTSIVWKNVASSLSKISGGNLINADIEAQGFFAAVLSNIPVKSNVTERWFLPCSMLFYAGNSEFAQYLALQNNFNPISQIRPIFSNIAGGLGLFTNVRSKTIPMRVHPSTVRVMATPNITYPQLPLLRFTR